MIPSNRLKLLAWLLLAGLAFTCTTVRCNTDGSTVGTSLEEAEDIDYKDGDSELEPEIPVEGPFVPPSPPSPPPPPPPPTSAQGYAPGQSYGPTSSNYSSYQPPYVPSVSYVPPSAINSVQVSQSPVSYGHQQPNYYQAYSSASAYQQQVDEKQSNNYQLQTPSYAPVQEVYSPPSVILPPLPPPVYQQPSSPPQDPTYPQVQSNYSAPSYQQQQTSYAPIKTNYSTPAYLPPVPIQQNYAQKPTYGASPSNYSNSIIPSAGYQQSKYSIGDLTPFVLPFGYISNHWTLFYYQDNNYQKCPKNLYLAGPSIKDVEQAFAFAQQQILNYQRMNIQYLNATHHSWATTHQFFSYVSQKDAKMDEEGMLLEFVSYYIAQRACLTKWDKQHYLPSMTKFISVSNFPGSHSCNSYYKHQANTKTCGYSKYRTIDGFCNNPYHPYWGKSNVCHIRLLGPDYSDGIAGPRVSYNPKYPLPNPRIVSSIIHNDIPIEGPYNLMKMQWGQLINHDITNTALPSYDGLIDCCKNPSAKGCYPIYVPPGDKFYGYLNVTCLNFIRSGICPLCQLGPRQQLNKNTAFLDASQVYGNTQEEAIQLRSFRGGLLRTSVSRNGEPLLPLASKPEQCSGSVCYLAGDSRVNQHPTLTVLQTLLMRRHNQVALGLARVHPNWNDEILYQEARRIATAEYQMITFNEYFPIVFGPVLSAYYKLHVLKSGYTYFDPHVDPTTWNEYSTASCRFGHSQISSIFGVYSQVFSYGQKTNQETFRLKDWFMRPSQLQDGLIRPLVNGLLSRVSYAVDPWVADDVRNHLYQSYKERSGGDLAATNIQRGRDHAIPGYVHYIEYCFNYKARTWKDLELFIPPFTLSQLRSVYGVVENIDLFTGGLSEKHFPGADIGPTFACINGIQYYHLKYGDRFYFEHGGQPGSFSPIQLDEIRRSTLARFLCRTAYIQQTPLYAFLQPSVYNPLVNCSSLGEIDYYKF